MTDQNKPEDAIPEDKSPVEPVKKTPPLKTASKPGGGTSVETHEELPYIDDPVSKWWIAIIVAVFALIFAWAIFFGGGGLFDGLLDSGDASPSPEPSLVVTPEPSASVTPEPSLVVTPGPSTSVTPEPAASELPSATPEATVPIAEPTAEATARPSETSPPQPTPEPSAPLAASQEPVASPAG